MLGAGVQGAGGHFGALGALGGPFQGDRGQLGGDLQGVRGSLSGGPGMLGGGFLGLSGCSGRLVTRWLGLRCALIVHANPRVLSSGLGC